MFIIYTLDDKILLKPDDLNIKSEIGNKFYEEIVLDKVREKYIGKVKKKYKNIKGSFKSWYWNFNKKINPQEKSNNRNRGSYKY
jgi:hypothetical protein